MQGHRKFATFSCCARGIAMRLPSRPHVNAAAWTAEFSLQHWRQHDTAERVCRLDPPLRPGGASAAEPRPSEADDPSPDHLIY